MTPGRLFVGRIVMAGAMVLGVAAGVPASAATSSDIVGSWVSVDREGARQSMTIDRTEGGEQLIVNAETTSSLACGGLYARAEGVGKLSYETRQMSATMSVACACGAFTTEVLFDWHPDKPVLIDSFGSVWERSTADS